MELNENLEIQLDVNAILDVLLTDPRFLAMFRTEILKMARNMGNIYGQWAQQSAPSTATRNRLT